MMPLKPGDELLNMRKAFANRMLNKPTVEDCKQADGGGMEQMS